LQKREANALPNTWWSTLDKGTREYLRRLAKII
jgi:hypothetical protein